MSHWGVPGRLFRWTIRTLELIASLRRCEEFVEPFSSAREETQWFVLASQRARINLLYASLQAVVGAEPERWETLFELFDDNMNSTLSYAELQQMMEGCGIHMTHEEFIHVAQAIDADGNNEIDIDEDWVCSCSNEMIMRGCHIPRYRT